MKHPLRSAGRLLPLAVKERMNQLVGRELFDLRFYLQFQPQSIALAAGPIQGIEYATVAPARKRVALITPHLGPGGAEKVLLDIAGACDRSEYEIILVATQSEDDRWISRWREKVDHIYDLARIVLPEQMPAAIYSLAKNWAMDLVLVQNTLAAYTVVRALKKARPETHIVDLIHAVDEHWDIVKATRAAGPYFDERIAVSEAARERLLETGISEDKVRLIRSGIDLKRFTPAAVRSEQPHRILFAGRLDPVKQPLLLVDIATELRQRDTANFEIVVAGDGPESSRLRERVQRAGLEGIFKFLGNVSDMAPVFQSADVLVVTSRTEGIPLAALEAMACARPVVALNAGAVGEVVDETTGVLISNSKNPAADLAEAISELLADPGCRETLGRQGRARIESDYDAQRAAAAYRDLFTYLRRWRT